MYIKKVLFFKIMAICLTVCIAIDTLGYAAPNLRANLMFEETNLTPDEKRTGNLKQTILSEHEIKKRLKSILESLRPDFEGKEELSLRKFEKHVRKLNRKLGFSYYILNINDPISMIVLNIKNLYTSLKHKKPIGVLASLFALLCLYFHPVASDFSKSSRSGHQRQTIWIAGKIAFIIPLSALALVFLLSETLPIRLIIWWGTGAIINFIQAYFYRDRFLAHEVKETYINACVQKLKEMKVISLSKDEEHRVSTYEPLQGFKKTISISDLNEIEEKFVEDVYKYVNPEILTSNQLQDEEKSDVAKLKEWMKLEPVFPIDVTLLSNFKGLIFKKGQLFGSGWNWMGERPLKDTSFSPPDFHYGVDISEYENTDEDGAIIPMDTDIKAVLSGTVRIVDEQKVIVESKDGKMVIYKHITPLVKQGQKVHKGDNIARFSQFKVFNLPLPPHLHLQVLNGKFPSPENHATYDEYIKKLVEYIEAIESKNSFDPLLLWPNILKNSKIEKDDTKNKSSSFILQGSKEAMQFL